MNGLCPYEFKKNPTALLYKKAALITFASNPGLIMFMGKYMIKSTYLINKSISKVFIFFC